MTSYTDVAPEWSDDINYYLGGAIRILAGMAVFQGAADVVECSDRTVDATGCLVASAVLSVSAALVPYMTYKFYEEVVLAFQNWATRKINQ